MIDNEMVHHLADAIESLPEGPRDAVILHDLLGHPLAVVAQRLKCGEREVAWLLLCGYHAIHARVADSSRGDRDT
jgi:DNA-directed RNA polymerase specialized sigma24 family protein